MVMATGREEEETIKEEVEEGFVEKTEEYEYLGFWINEKGNCETHIEKKGKKIMGEVNGIKTLGSKENVGPLFINTRLFLYEACIVQSVLYQLETWLPILKKTELARLESLQGKILCSMLQLPKTTPYWGLLHETGVWSIKWRLIYRGIMLFHNVMRSDESRLAKHVLQQQIEEGYDDSFANLIQLRAAELGIEDIINQTKSVLKKEVKKQVKNKMELEITEKLSESSKLRFIATPVVFERAGYFNDLSGDEIIQVLKIRLNMVDIYGNYKGDLTKCRKCPHCRLEEDTTEHLVECDAVIGEKIGRETLTSNATAGWKDILKIVDINLSGRK